MVRRLGVSKYDRRIRAIVLASMGGTLLIWGWGYLSPSWVPTPSMSLIDAVVPIQAWAAVWIAAGIGCVLGIAVPQLARVSMATGASLWATWFVFYCLSWITLDAQRAWMPAAPFGMLAVAMFVFTILMEPASAVRKGRQVKGRQVKGHQVVVHRPLEES